MTSLELSSAGAAVPAASNDSASLPPPDALEPDDALSRFLLSLERMAASSLALTESRIDSTREDLKSELEHLLEKIRESVAALKKAEEGGGWFSDLVGAVAKVLGKVVGTVADSGLQIDTLVALVNGVCSGDNLARIVESVGREALRNGSTAEAVGGFTQGSLEFGADLATFAAKLDAALARAALSGESPWTLLKGDARELFASLERNILENPDFWAVIEAAGKGAALAGAVVTGGAVAIAAVALVVTLELDRRTNVLEKAIGSDAAPYARLALELGGTVCLGVAALAGDPDRAARLLQAGAGMLQGASGVHQGYRAIVESERAADALEDAAERLETLNRMQKLQRLLEALVHALDRDEEDRTITRDLGAGLVQTRVATDRALIVPA